MDYRFTADVTAEDYYLAVIVTDADGSAFGRRNGAPLGWYGTLDGRGHAIYNVQAGAGGMFGILTSQSVLKNVAVIGGKTVTGGKYIVPETGAEHANSFAGANAKNTGFLTRAIAGGTVSNVYIEMADMPQIDRFGTLAFIVKDDAIIELYEEK